MESRPATRRPAQRRQGAGARDAKPPEQMPTALSDGLQQRAAVQSQFALQRMLNQNPSVVTQAKLAETLSGSPVQRQDDLIEDDDVAQTKSSALQRRDMPDEADMPDEDELLQGKFQTVQRRTATGSDPSAEPIQRRENNTGLPDTLKAGVEQLSGMALDDVQVHYNSPQPAQLEALAYAQGTDIHVAPGQEQHLPHEAWHVAQQKQGRVSPDAANQRRRHQRRCRPGTRSRPDGRQGRERTVPARRRSRRHRPARRPRRRALDARDPAGFARFAALSDGGALRRAHQCRNRPPRRLRR